MVVFLLVKDVEVDAFLCKKNTKQRTSHLVHMTFLEENVKSILSQEQYVCFRQKRDQYSQQAVEIVTCLVQVWVVISRSTMNDKKKVGYRRDVANI